MQTNCHALSPLFVVVRWQIVPLSPTPFTSQGMTIAGLRAADKFQERSTGLDFNSGEGEFTVLDIVWR
jgi:hypothetical protein